MEARGGAVHELMRDVKAVDWLPLADAVDRLSRDYERAFLENVGPIALSAAAHATTARKARAKQPAPEKRRTKRPGVTVPAAVTPAPASPPPDQLLPQVAQQEDVIDIIDATAGAAIEEAQPAATPSFALEVEPVAVEAAETRTREQPRRNLLQRVRDWLRRTA
jgi:8-oxo-dGTP diphosphatase